MPPSEGCAERKCRSVCYTSSRCDVVGSARSNHAVARRCSPMWTVRNEQRSMTCAIDRRVYANKRPGSVPSRPPSSSSKTVRWWWWCWRWLLRWLAVTGLLLLVSSIGRGVQCQTFIRPATDIGDYCLHNDQCHYTLSTDSECRDNSCQCREGAHYVEREKRCYKTNYLGEYCRLTNNCIGNDTYCRDGICVCTPGKHPNADRNRCLQDAKLGDHCFRDEECVTDNSRCAQESCTCRVSHVLNENRNRCLPIASRIYDLCEESIQCMYNIPYSQCRITTGTDGITAGRCTCASRFHEAGYKCVSSVHLNGICEVNDNCIDPDTTCLHGRCRCIDHMIEEDGICSGAIPVRFDATLLLMVLLVASRSYCIS